MKRLALILFALTSQGAPQPVSIPIQNASFELPTNLPNNNACGQSTWQDIPGWKFIQPYGSSYGVIAWTCQPPCDGKNMAFLAYGASMSQDLGIKPQVGRYDLTLCVGSWFYSYSASYVISLTIAGKPVCSMQSYVLGDFIEVTLPCLMSGNVVNDHDFSYGPGDLGISISSDVGGIIVNRGWPLLVDNLSLTFTPSN